MNVSSNLKGTMSKITFNENSPQSTDFAND